MVVWLHLTAGPGILCTTTFNRTFLMRAIIYCYVVLKFSFCVAFPACKQRFLLWSLKAAAQVSWREATSVQPVCNQSATTLRQTASTLQPVLMLSVIFQVKVQQRRHYSWDFISNLRCSVWTQLMWISVDFHSFLSFGQKQIADSVSFLSQCTKVALNEATDCERLQTCSSLAARLHTDAVIRSRSLFQLLLR